jgi:hypothetical protein
MSRLISGKITAPTKMGQINAEYKNEGNKSTYVIALPSGMKGEFVLLQNKYSGLFVNKTKFKTEAGVIALKPGLNTIEILR